MGLAFYRGKHSKFNAAPSRCSQGVMHHSTIEAARCTELHLMQQGGLIRDLEAHPQPRVPLLAHDSRTGEGVEVCHYLPDFRYVDVETGETVTEDVKGFRTPEYALKAKLFAANYGTEIVEVRRVRGRR